MLKWDEYTAAAQELSPSALNLYMYLAKNQDGYNFAFSSKDFCDTFKVVDKTFRNARGELEKKGYLRKNSNNKMIFSSCAAFKLGDKETYKKELSALFQKIKVSLEQEEVDDFFNEVAKAKLKDIDDDNVYIATARDLINKGESLLKEFARNQIDNII